ncbi:hypothetical protein N566_02700 [Streptomycetaceae bacterium MP113-05]|nr:hypothetical protein N566_02700 [Streptomycetaceae bacterium MP113-05]
MAGEPRRRCSRGAYAAPVFFDLGAGQARPLFRIAPSDVTVRMIVAELVDLGDGALKVYTQSSIETEYIYNEIFREGCYDGVELPERPLILDAGGNIGMFALFMKGKYPGAEVVSFEPMPESIELFHRNMALHEIGVFELSGGAEASDGPRRHSA